MGPPIPGRRHPGRAGARGGGTGVERLPVGSRQDEDISEPDKHGCRRLCEIVAQKWFTQHESIYWVPPIQVPYLLQLSLSLKLLEGQPMTSSVWREDPGLLSRPCMSVTKSYLILRSYEL